MSPFTFGKIVTGKYFTDREQDKKRIADNINSKVNTILISPRRWGKSSLIKRVQEEAAKRSKRIRFCVIDLFNIRTELEFYQTLSQEILRVSSTGWDNLIETSKHFIKRIKPKFNFSTDPMNDFTVTLEWDELKQNPDEILNLAEKICKDKKLDIVVCIDEFQNISHFSDPLAFQKKLRANLQHHQKAVYCFYGSKRHLMMQLFENKSMPFYKFGDVIYLQKIDKKYWVEYITSRFRKTGKLISKENAADIASHMENHPYFVQQLAHIVWVNTKDKGTEKIIEKSLDDLLNQNAILYQRDLDNMTNYQLNFLKALCGNNGKLSSSETIRKYNLGTSANVIRIKNSLEGKEIIDITGKKIEFIDPAFKLWLKKYYLHLL